MRGTVLLSTGEASGDVVASHLLREMRTLGFEGEAFAVGAGYLKAAQAQILADSSRWGALGIYQSLRVAPRVFAEYRRLLHWMRQHKPNLVIAVDFGFFNVRLLRHAKRLGCKTLYFMPPGSWRKDKQGKDLPEISDRIATPFLWSAEILKRMGAHVEWVGHPILQIAGNPSRALRDGIAVLPGSRQHEVGHNLPVIARALERLGERAHPIRLALAPTVNPAFIHSIWTRATDLPVELQAGPAVETLKQCRAAVVCSGTATLESAVTQTPMVIVYRGDRIMELEYRIRKPRFEHIGLPSILLGRRVCPELIQRDATQERIAKELQPLIEEGSEARQAQLQAFEELRSLLGPANALTRTAEIALDLLAGTLSGDSE